VSRRTCTAVCFSCMGYLVLSGVIQRMKLRLLGRHRHVSRITGITPRRPTTMTTHEPLTRYSKVKVCTNEWIK